MRRVVVTVLRALLGFRCPWDLTPTTRPAGPAAPGRGVIAGGSLVAAARRRGYGPGDVRVMALRAGGGPAATPPAPPRPAPVVSVPGRLVFGRYDERPTARHHRERTLDHARRVLGRPSGKLEHQLRGTRVPPTVYDGGPVVRVALVNGRPA